MTDDTSQRELDWFHIMFAQQGTARDHQLFQQVFPAQRWPGTTEHIDPPTTITVPPPPAAYMFTAVTVGLTLILTAAGVRSATTWMTATGVGLAVLSVLLLRAIIQKTKVTFHADGITVDTPGVDAEVAWEHVRCLRWNTRQADRVHATTTTHTFVIDRGPDDPVPILPGTMQLSAAKDLFGDLTLPVPAIFDMDQSQQLQRQHARWVAAAVGADLDFTLGSPDALTTADLLHTTRQAIKRNRGYDPQRAYDTLRNTSDN